MQNPEQLVFRSVKDLENMRALRNQDGSWMRLYHRSTNRKLDFLSSLSVIGEGLLRRAIAVGFRDG